MTYPARDKYYAHKLTRLLFKSCAAQAIGQDAVLLVIHIAHTEDAARYQGPVRFWNSQLNEVLGFRSPKSLNNARMKAVDSGWLVYSRKNDRSDGLYYTTIPKNVLAFDDEPIEPVPVSVPVSIPSTESIPLSIPSTEQKAEQESYALRNRKVTGNDPPPNPVPIPNPKYMSGRNDRTSYSEEFETFWKAFPSIRREKKGKAYEAWKRILKRKDAPTANTIIEAAKRYASSPKGRSEYASGPVPWLNGSCWEDAPEAWGLVGKPLSNVPQKKPYTLPARETA